MLTALLMALGLLLACGGGGGDDDDNAGDDDNDSGDDDAADDDAADDDDDNDTGGLTISNVTQSECLDGAGGSKDEPWDPLTDPIDVIQVARENGVVKIEDLFAYANCGFELEVQAEYSGGALIVTEIGNGTIMDCTCPFNFNYEVAGVPDDIFTVQILRQDVGETSTHEVFNSQFSFGAAQNKKWYVPYIEVFMAGDPGASPFQARIAACYLHHLDDQQFAVREDQGMFHVLAYDWFDLDDPGTPDPNCQMPVWVDIGDLPAGDYHFGAPSFHDDEWSMLTFDVTI
jgi:hypothetical protein